MDDGTYDKSFSQDCEEVIDPSRIELGLDGPYPNSLLVDHLHHLPLLAVLRWTAVLRAPEVVLRVAMALPWQLRLDDDLAEVALIFLDAFDDVIAYLYEVLLLDHEAE